MGNFLSSGTPPTTSVSPLASGLAPPKNNKGRVNVALPAPAPAVAPAASASPVTSSPSLPKIGAAAQKGGRRSASRKHRKQRKSTRRQQRR